MVVAGLHPDISYLLILQEYPENLKNTGNEYFLPLMPATGIDFVLEYLLGLDSV